MELTIVGDYFYLKGTCLGDILEIVVEQRLRSISEYSTYKGKIVGGSEFEIDVKRGSDADTTFGVFMNKHLWAMVKDGQLILELSNYV